MTSEVSHPLRSWFAVLVLFGSVFTCSVCDDPEPTSAEDGGSDKGTNDSTRCDAAGSDTSICYEDLAVPPEPFRLGDAPDGAEQSPQLVWSRRRFCPEVDPSPDLISAQDFAYTEVEIDGAEQGVVLAVQQTHTAGFIQSAVAVAMLNPDTGETLHCFDPPSFPGHPPEGGLPVSGGLEAAFFGVTSEQRLWSTVTLDLASRASPDFRPVELPSLPVHQNSIGVTGSGQLVTQFTGWGLVGTDAFSGELVWTLREDKLSQYGFADGAEFEAVFAPRPDVLLAYVIFDAEHGFLELDENGDKVAIHEPPRDAFTGARGYDAPLLLNRRIVLSQYGGGHTVVLEDWTGDVVYKEPFCTQTIALSDVRLACLKTRNSDEGSGFLAVFDVDGGNRRLIDLPVELGERPGEPLDARHMWLVAGAGQHLVVNTKQVFMNAGSLEDSYTELEIAIVDPDAESPIESTFTVDDDGVGSNGSVAIPAITPDGMLIVSALGHLYAIQTDLDGLAKSPYPRGRGLGGNENRGYVHVPGG